MKFIYSWAVVFIGLLLGYVIQILVRCRRIELGISIGDLRIELIIENMMNWPPARRAYASESVTADSMFIAARPYGRTIKKVLRT